MSVHWPGNLNSMDRSLVSSTSGLNFEVICIRKACNYEWRPPIAHIVIAPTIRSAVYISKLLLVNWNLKSQVHLHSAWTLTRSIRDSETSIDVVQGPPGSGRERVNNKITSKFWKHKLNLQFTVCCVNPAINILLLSFFSDRNDRQGDSRNVSHPLVRILMEANIGHLSTKFGHNQMQGWKVINRYGHASWGGACLRFVCKFHVSRDILNLNHCNF